MTSSITATPGSTSTSNMFSAPQANSIPEQKRQMATAQQPQDVFVREHKSGNSSGLFATTLGLGGLIVGIIALVKAGKAKTIAEEAKTSITTDVKTEITKALEEFKSKVVLKTEEVKTPVNEVKVPTEEVKKTGDAGAIDNKLKTGEESNTAADAGKAATNKKTGTKSGKSKTKTDTNVTEAPAQDANKTGGTVVSQDTTKVGDVPKTDAATAGDTKVNEETKDPTKKA